MVVKIRVLRIYAKNQALLADMEFKDTDTEKERELEMRVLCTYAKRLDCVARWLKCGCCVSMQRTMLYWPRWSSKILTLKRSVSLKCECCVSMKFFGERIW